MNSESFFWFFSTNILIPPAGTEFIITEDDADIITEDGDQITTE